MDRGALRVPLRDLWIGVLQGPFKGSMGAIGFRVLRYLEDHGT